MKKIDRKDLISVLDLDFSKYEYFMDYLPYRQKGKKTEYFDRDDLAWKEIDFDAKGKWNTPFAFDIAKADKEQQETFIDLILEYVNRRK